MSKLDTKGFAGLKRAKRNRMIPGFYCKPEEREASFVSDLDTCSHRSATLVATPTPATHPARRSDVTPPWARTRPARVATVRTGLRH